MSVPISFTPGDSPPPSGLLARYLPPIPGGIAIQWAKNHLPQGAWVLEPFGSSPYMAAELARSGFRVLVAANNPISRLLYELAANPPTELELRSALAEIAATRKGEERLETHLRSLYRTTCAQCGQPVEAQAYLWERDKDAPYARIYHCPACGDSGERPVTSADLLLAQSFPTSGLHRARALERIAPKGDPDRIHAEEALSSYLPRSIYVITTLINRLEVLFDEERPDLQRSGDRLRCLYALALLAFDHGNVLWSHLTDRPRPRQLTPSPHFRENNIWLALEGAPSVISTQQQPVPVTSWPTPPPVEGGLMIFEGPVRELALTFKAAEHPVRIHVDAVITAIPRPNQAFWTLSALWAGWLWSREAIGPFISVIRRRRYDWAWHCTALHLALSALTKILERSTPVFACIGEIEAGLLSSALLAGKLAGLELRGIAVRNEWDLAQVCWHSPGLAGISHATQATQFDIAKTVEKLTFNAAINHLNQRGEPAPYILLHTAALEELSKAGSIVEGLSGSPGETYSLIHPAIQETFSPRAGFSRFGGGEKSIEASQQWHDQLSPAEMPLADQVENVVYRYLQSQSTCTFTAMDEHLCRSFPGLLTPDSILIRVCLESYTEAAGENDLRRLREEDRVEFRKLELGEIRSALQEIGIRLGFVPRGEQPLIWLEHKDQPRFVFYLSTISAFWNIVYQNPYPPGISFLVIPGARASIVVYKLRRNPLLKQEIDKGWRLLKFRHIRHLLESPALSRENFEELLLLDPMTESPSQMRLL